MDELDINRVDIIVYGLMFGGFCVVIVVVCEGVSVILLELIEYVGVMNIGGLSYCDLN